MLPVFYVPFFYSQLLCLFLFKIPSLSPSIQPANRKSNMTLVVGLWTPVSYFLAGAFCLAKHFPWCCRIALFVCLLSMTSVSRLAWLGWAFGILAFLLTGAITIKQLKAFLWFGFQDASASAAASTFNSADTRGVWVMRICKTIIAHNRKDTARPQNHFRLTSMHTNCLSYIVG